LRSSRRLVGIVVALACCGLGPALMAASSRADPLSTGAALGTSTTSVPVASPPATNADVGSPALDTQAPASDSTAPATPDPVSGGAPDAGSTSGGSSSASSSDSTVVASDPLGTQTAPGAPPSEPVATFTDTTLTDPVTTPMLTDPVGSTTDSAGTVGGGALPDPVSNSVGTVADPAGTL